MNLIPTDHLYREDCIRAENRAEIAEEDLANLKTEVQTAHRVLDSHVGRIVDYRRFGQRLMSLPERIDAFIEKFEKNEGDGWERYQQQMRANEALVADLKALRESFDRVEAENLQLAHRVIELNRRNEIIAANMR